MANPRTPDGLNMGGSEGKPTSPAERVKALAQAAEKAKTDKLAAAEAANKADFEGRKKEISESRQEIETITTEIQEYTEALTALDEVKTFETTEVEADATACRKEFTDKIQELTARKAELEAKIKDHEDDPNYAIMAAEEKPRREAAERAQREKDEAARLEAAAMKEKERQEKLVQAVEHLAESLHQILENFARSYEATKQATLSAEDEARKMHTAYNEALRIWGSLKSAAFEKLPPKHQARINKADRNTDFPSKSDRTKISDLKKDPELKPSSFFLSDRPLKAYLALEENPALLNLEIASNNLDAANKKASSTFKEQEALFEKMITDIGGSELQKETETLKSLLPRSFIDSKVLPSKVVDLMTFKRKLENLLENVRSVSNKSDKEEVVHVRELIYPLNQTVELIQTKITNETEKDRKKDWGPTITVK